MIVGFSSLTLSDQRCQHSDQTTKESDSNANIRIG